MHLSPEALSTFVVGFSTSICTSNQAWRISFSAGPRTQSAVKCLKSLHIGTSQGLQNPWIQDDALASHSCRAPQNPEGLPFNKPLISKVPTTNPACCNQTRLMRSKCPWDSNIPQSLKRPPIEPS